LTDQTDNGFFLRKETPKERVPQDRGVLSVMRRIVMYSSIFVVCTVYSIVMYSLYSRNPVFGIGLLSVSTVSATFALVALACLSISLVVRFRLSARDKSRTLAPDPESEPEAFPDSDSWTEDGIEE